MVTISEGAYVLYVEEVREQMALPVYLYPTTREMAAIQAGGKYVMVYDDGDKEHWLHEVTCLGYMPVDMIDDLPPTVLAFLTEQRSRDGAIDFLQKYAESSSDLWVGIMLRTDVAQTVVTEGIKGLGPLDSVEEEVDQLGVVVDNGQNTTVTKTQIKEGKL